jgi:hypothetical protein
MATQETDQPHRALPYCAEIAILNMLCLEKVTICTPKNG